MVWWARRDEGGSSQRLVVNQAELASDAGRIVVVATFDDHLIGHTHHAAVAGLHEATRGWECSEAGLKRPGLRAAFDEFDYCSVVLNDHSRDLERVPSGNAERQR